MLDTLGRIMGTHNNETKACPKSLVAIGPTQSSSFKATSWLLKFNETPKPEVSFFISHAPPISVSQHSTMASPLVSSASATLFSLFCILFIIKTHVCLALTDPSLNPTSDIHDLLPQYGFPRGLIPDNVKSYTLSPSGDFSVQFSSPCYVHFDEVVYYAQEIKGKLSYGAIHDVSGIQAKKLFVWLPVTGIEVSKDGDGMIEFFVGPLSEKLPASQFQDVPTCKSKTNLNLDSM